MARSIHVMVVDDSEESRASLTMLLEFVEGIEVVAEAKDGVEALAKLAVINVDIVLMDIEMPNMDGITATEKISLLYPEVAVIVQSVEDDVAHMKRCMRAGAKDFLTKPIAVEELTRTIENVAQLERHRHTRTTVAVLADRFTQRAKIVALLSAKGGVGKTTIATAMATAYASQGKRVVYVDFDLQFGDGGLFFNLQPTKTMLDLLRESSEIDGEVLEQYLTVHTSGVHVLAAPARPEEAEYITAAQVRTVLQALRKRFDVVVVDTAPLANDIFFTVLETADTSYMVSTLNLAVLKNNRLLLDLLHDIGYEGKQIRHILNRANAKSGLRVRDVERVLKSPVYWEMDNDYQFVESAINEGTPFVLRDGKHRLSRQIYALTARIETEEGNRVPRRNPLRRLFASKQG